MKLIDAIGVAALVTLSLSSFAQQKMNAEDIMRPPANITMSVLQPPKRFDHAFKGKTTEYRMFIDAARYMCKTQGAEADSCSWVKEGRCYIVVPWDGPVKDPSEYQRHEIAHCNGWGANHEK